MFPCSSYNTYNENPSSPRQTIENSSAFVHFPTSFLDEDDEFLVSRWLSQNQSPQKVLVESSSLARTERSFVVAKDGSKSNYVNVQAHDQQRLLKEVDKSKSKKSTKQSAPRKRSGKKDRHSKINTAQGPRDRRMRLSLQIARRFFDLQDMLGFNKASKTIEWLLTRSKSAIKELTKNVQQGNPRSSNGAKSMSSTSENEVVSGIENQGFIVSVEESPSLVKSKERKRRIRTCKVGQSPIGKESRDKARARARERTREKMKDKGIMEEISKRTSGQSPSNQHLRQKLDGSMESTNQDMNSALTGVVKDKEPIVEADSLSLIENVLGFASAIPTFSSSSAVLSGTNFKDALPSFPGNLEIDLNNNHAIRNMNHPVKANVLLQFPEAASSVTSSQIVHFPCVQGHSNTMAQRHNPRRTFRNTSNTEDLNPNPSFQEHFDTPAFKNAPDVYLHSLLPGNQFYCNPTSTSRNDSLF